jgi:hypothetical protein
MAEGVVPRRGVAGGNRTRRSTTVTTKTRERPSTAASYFDTHHQASRKTLARFNKMNDALNELDVGNSVIRRIVAPIVLSKLYETFINLVVVTNLFVIIFDADEQAKLSQAKLSDGRLKELTECGWWLKTIGDIFLGIYCVDLTLNGIAYATKFHHDNMRIFDFLVVAVDLFFILLTAISGQALMKASMLRVFRLAKLLRAMKLVGHIKELYMIISGFTAAMRSLSFGMVILFVLVTFWSILPSRCFTCICWKSQNWVSSTPASGARAPSRTCGRPC